MPVHTPDYRMNTRPSLNFPTSILMGGLNESVLFTKQEDGVKSVEKLRHSEEMYLTNILLLLFIEFIVLASTIAL